MIWALLAVGIGCGAVGVYIGGLGMAILASRKIEHETKLREMAVSSATRWRNQALAAERWLPTEIITELLTKEQL